MASVQKLELVNKNETLYAKLQFGTNNINIAAATLMISFFGGRYEVEEDGSVLYHYPGADFAKYLEMYYKLAHVFDTVCELILEDVITVKQAEEQWSKTNLGQNASGRLWMRSLGDYRRNNLAITTRSAMERLYGSS